jgi:hypothetical protein
MKFPFFALLLAIPFSSLKGQSSVPQNKIRIWDQSTEYTSRGSVGGGTGHLSQAFPPGINRGLDRLSFIQYVTQDQKMQTKEPWEIKIAPLDLKGEPDYKRAVILLRNLTLPNGTGIRAFTITHNRNSARNGPFVLSALKDVNKKPLLNPKESFHFVWNFVQKANWLTDGISFWMSQAGRTLPNGGTGQLTCWQNRFHREIPRAEKFDSNDPTSQIIERLAWTEFNGSPGRKLFTDRSWSLTLGFAEPTLQGSVDNKTFNNSPCLNPNTGYAALDPDFANRSNSTPARNDDYQWTVEAGGSYAGGIGILFFSDSVFPNPLSLGGINGTLSLDTGSPLFGLGPFPMGVLDVKGAASLKVALGPSNSPLRKALSNLPALHAQAYVVKAGVRPSFSSLFALRPSLKPVGFQRGTVVASTPLRLKKGSLKRSLMVRNDGPGLLEIKTFIGNTQIGPVVQIPERTAVRHIIFPAATILEISTKKTKKVYFAYL